MRVIKVEKTASRGLVVAKAYKYTVPDLNPETNIVFEVEHENEIAKFEQAKSVVKQELENLSVQNAVFAAHLEIADDFTLQEGIVSKIKSQNKNAQMAVYETIEEISAMFSGIDDPYMQERAADIKDVGKRFMATLKDVTLPDLGSLDKEVIVVANDLYPSDTVKIDTKFVKGIITQEGGVTSHVFIIAKSLDIPILVGVGEILDQLDCDELVCMDAQLGEIVINPDEGVVDFYKGEIKKFNENKEKLTALRSQKITAKDGRKITLCANVGSLKDIENALPMAIDGVGLFRSEFLYMENSHFPTEEEQFEVYKRAAQLCPEELTIRTLDIGGDKELSYFEFEKEENPFLGWRAVRICLEMKDMFKEQLRAILRASIYGNVRVMIPMLISIEELEEVKVIFEQCKKELDEKGIEYNKQIKLGMMIETPSSVLLADEFAKIADFFSIGTNDLTQYLLAVDRGNKKVADKYSYFHKAVTSAIKTVIDAGHRHGIKVGMCGEMAGDTKASEMLLDMGLDEFSMSASSVDYVREELIEKTK
ncbi:MAG: phosphoenolpyruvate--protein phosphotransferase [Clostridia bacterium]